MLIAKDVRRRKVNTMKYEPPEMTVLMPAIKAIQSDGGLPKGPHEPPESFDLNESVSAYTDWE
jgi:hypothetical protein